MDANSQPEKANPAAGTAHGRDNAADPANTPRIESPSLVPEQGEPAVAESAAETSSIVPSTALIVAASEPQREQAGPTEEVRKTRRLPNWRLTKISSLAASLALAVGVGVIAGAIGTVGLQRVFAPEVSANSKTMQESLVRLSS